MSGYFPDIPHIQVVNYDSQKIHWYYTSTTGNDDLIADEICTHNLYKLLKWPFYID